MTEELVCLAPQDSLVRAIEVMQDVEIRHVPIVDVLSHGRILWHSSIERKEKAGIQSMPK